MWTRWKSNCLRRRASCGGTAFVILSDDGAAVMWILKGALCLRRRNLRPHLNQQIYTNKAFATPAPAKSKTKSRAVISAMGFAIVRWICADRPWAFDHATEKRPNVIVPMVDSH